MSTLITLQFFRSSPTTETDQQEYVARSRDLNSIDFTIPRLQPRYHKKLTRGIVIGSCIFPKVSYPTNTISFPFMETASFTTCADTSNLAQHIPLDNKKNKFRGAIEPTTGLQALPIEIFQQCLRYLDIESLTTMRRVSQFARKGIDAMPQYRELYEHAPQALRACLSTGFASYIPLMRLHHSLTTMEGLYCKES